VKQFVSSVTVCVILSVVKRFMIKIWYNWGYVWEWLPLIKHISGVNGFVTICMWVQVPHTAGRFMIQKCANVILWSWICNQCVQSYLCETGATLL
jgi:hypothetical protein